MDDRIRAAEALEPSDVRDGRPTEAFWFKQLDAVNDSFSRRPRNDIVRMKIRAEVKRLQTLAEELDDVANFDRSFSKWREMKLNPQTKAATVAAATGTFVPGPGFDDVE